jgi:hypothetical protein
VISDGKGDIIINGIAGSGIDGANIGVVIGGYGTKGSVQSNEGMIRIFGTGGNGNSITGSDNSGVVIESGSRVKTTLGPRIEIQGTGGSVQGHGVRIGTWNVGFSSVEALNGNIQITGYGSNGGKINGNYGVILFSSYIISGNQGSVSINGTGGTSAGSYNFGIGSKNSQIRSYDGDIDLNGIGGGGLGNGETGGSDHGISMEFGGQVIAEGFGNITINGIAGNGINGNNIGFSIQGASDSGQLAVVGTNTGFIGINGQGGLANSIIGPDNLGVLINDRASVVTASGKMDIIGRAGINGGIGVRVGGVADDTSLGLQTISGDIAVTGYGSDGSDNFNWNVGVVIWYRGIKAGENGRITLNGTGGRSNGGWNYGVLVYYSCVSSQNGEISVIGNGGTSLGSYNYGFLNFHSLIATVDGEISMTGFGGGGVDGAQSGGGNYGILFEDGARVISSGLGNITLNGTAGTGTNGNNIGVFILGNSLDGQITLVQTAGGKIKMNGRGGGADSSTGSGNHGVSISGRGSVVSIGDGSIDINGRAGVHGGIGIQLSDWDRGLAEIKSQGGDITLNGYGCDGRGTSHNRGVNIMFGHIATGKTATITLNGTGGKASEGGGWNYGVLVYVSSVTTHDGDVFITGVGGGTVGTENFGVQIGHSTKLRGTGLGNIRIYGSSTAAGGISNQGVKFWGTKEADSNVSGSGKYIVETNRGSIFVIGLSGSGSVDTSGILFTEQGDLVTLGGGDIFLSGRARNLLDPTSLSIYGQFSTNTRIITNSGGTITIDAPEGVRFDKTLKEFDGRSTAFFVNTVLRYNLSGVVSNLTYDQTNISGTIDLNGASLSLSGSYVTTPGDLFMLIDNDGIDPIIGIFTGIPEGTRIYHGASQYLISYIGGDGNDVTLRAAIPISPLQNNRNMFDVDGDNTVSPLDVLFIVNELNRVGPTIPIGAFQTKPPYLDVNGDFTVSPLDVLLVINFINAQGDAEGEIRSSDDLAWASFDLDSEFGRLKQKSFDRYRK